VLGITTSPGSAFGDEAFEWQVGLDDVARIAPGRFGIPAAAKGFWASADPSPAIAAGTFIVQLDEIGNNFVWRLTLVFEDNRVTLTMQDMTGFLPEDGGAFPLEFSGTLQEGEYYAED
jgi:hypothetical protein